jgi:hypothetical protein
VQAGLEVLFRGARVANADFDTGTNGILQPHTHRINQIHDLDMRIAILRARLSRDPADIDAAATVLQRNFDAVLATAADNAEEHSGEFCEFHGEPDQDRLSTLERACDEENSLAARTVNFWRNRAHLDLVMAADPAHYEPQPRQRWEDGSAFARTAAGSNDIESRGWITSFNTAERLLRNGGFRGIPASWDELPLLLLARADLHARWARALGDSRQSYPAIEQTGRALDYLASAAEITPAHRYPALYRRIAETYLRLWDAPSGDSNDSWRDSTDRRRLAVLLRRTLAALDAITIGDEAGH